MVVMILLHNYDPNVDSLAEGSCIEAVVGCLNLYMSNLTSSNIDDTPSLCSTLITFGCTDPRLQISMNCQYKSNLC